MNDTTDQTRIMQDINFNLMREIFVSFQHFSKIQIIDRSEVHCT